MDRAIPRNGNWLYLLPRIVLLLLLLGIISTFLGSLWRDNRAADLPLRETVHPEWTGRSYGYAPHPAEAPEAVVQVYAARTRGTKQLLAVHTWVATKRTGASSYTVSEIFGWRLERQGTALRQGQDVPDHDWYGHPPTLLVDIRGEEAAEIIPQIAQAIQDYPYQKQYTAWPGPNSNTFTAWVGREVPALRLDLPATAIGKDYRPWHQIIGLSPSGTGVQMSLFGLLGFSLGWEEGLEFNLLGLSYELDVFDLAVELPGLGRIGADQVSLPGAQ